jgi:hypothetical protein
MWSRLTAIALFLSMFAYASAQEYSSKIDLFVEQTVAQQQHVPGRLCSDELFLRRATLDLCGRIPTADELNRFRLTPNRAKLIDQLLESDEFVSYWASLWTTQWYGYTTDDDADRANFDHWLETELKAKTPYDEVVHKLVTVQGQSAFVGPVSFFLRHAEEPVVKISRSFLGVRLDCARCHDHPFDRWTEDDFQKMNLFFSGLEQREVSRGNVQLVDVVMQAEDSQRPRFLTGAVPRTSQWRAEFAIFMIKSKPFARNFANRIWYHLMGRGIVHPVDDFSRDNPPSHPELLEYLTSEVRKSKFDLRHMIRLVCNSQAYQRVSTADSNSPQLQQHFLIRSIKPLTPEQWYRSFCVATQRTAQADEEREFVRQYLSDSIDGDFSATWEYRETTQGLMSALLDRAAPPAGDLDSHFTAILGRSPTIQEREFFHRSSSREVSYVLLHSNEFSFNH